MADAGREQTPHGPFCKAFDDPENSNCPECVRVAQERRSRMSEKATETTVVRHADDGPSWIACCSYCAAVKGTGHWPGCRHARSAS